MRPDLDNRPVTVRQRREVVIDGVPRVEELYAAGHLDESGRLRLSVCVGYRGGNGHFAKTKKREDKSAA